SRAAGIAGSPERRARRLTRPPPRRRSARRAARAPPQLPRSRTPPLRRLRRGTPRTTRGAPQPPAAAEDRVCHRQRPRAVPRRCGLSSRWSSRDLPPCRDGTFIDGGRTQNGGSEREIELRSFAADEIGSFARVDAGAFELGAQV